MMPPGNNACGINWTKDVDRSPISAMRSDELDFHLPPELIAQSPSPIRSASRLLHYRRPGGRIEHRTFADLPRLLRRDDLLVFNDAKVLPARFVLRKNTGGRIEGLFLSEPAPGRWRVLLRNIGRSSDRSLLFESQPDLSATVTAVHDDGQYELEISSSEPALTILARVGRMPLPPYIKRDKDQDPRDSVDRDRYQTVYAAAPGSVAAPTAGLHFTNSILAELDSLGIQRAMLTLHVGLGTFKPITAESLENHTMHLEAFSVGAAAAELLNRAQTDNKRIVAIGTTSARVLESWPADTPWQTRSGETSIFIYPPYRWKRVGALLTNFHLPRSTLIALVAAFVGLEQQRALYKTAIEKRYHFFSYGDSMFLE
jgi:S-adenosylmethionine:tRNA ribosyltransferase-isomerase